MKNRHGVALYPQITVKWIDGKIPTLIINDNDMLDLTKYKSKEELHTLFQSKGFVNVSPKFSYYRDKNENCKEWAKEGQCQTNSLYMHDYCAMSCNKSEL